MDAQHDVYVVERKNGQYHFTLIQGVFRGIFQGQADKGGQLCICISLLYFIDKIIEKK